MDVVLATINGTNMKQGATDDADRSPDMPQFITEAL
jgi:hypothetical protein